MPVGKIIYFSGDIWNLINLLTDFFKVEVITPKFFKNPILQTKFKTNIGFRTIYPLGKWSAWLQSDEIYNAFKFGYKFKILEGYILNLNIFLIISLISDPYFMACSIIKWFSLKSWLVYNLYIYKEILWYRLLF